MKNSRNAFSFIEVILVLVIIGLLAAIFVPATTKVQEKVTCAMLDEQLLKIATAARKYFSENPLPNVKYSTLVNEKRIQKFNSIMGEDYDNIVINSTGGVLKLQLSNGKIHEFNY